jgi:bis(5'-nucleosyl)-tetraphosphatase (symmetrical)
MQRIFVGDVQGCGDELDELLARARSDFGDRLEVWFVGDLVNRGPHNLRVLRTVRDLVEGGRGRVVLGNHDVGLLMTAAGLRHLGPRDSIRDVLEAPDADDWIDWLRRRPLAVGGVLGERPFVMVHASVHPNWKLGKVLRMARRVEARLGDPDRTVFHRFLAKQPFGKRRDAMDRLTRCRSVAANGAWSDELPDATSRAWHRVWARRGHAYGVVYGHWALQGLHVAPGLRGLDTGCVHHGHDHDGALTAWLPDEQRANPFDVPDDRFWQVSARRVYYNFS